MMRVLRRGLRALKEKWIYFVETIEDGIEMGRPDPCYIGDCSPEEIEEFLKQRRERVRD